MEGTTDVMALEVASLKVKPATLGQDGGGDVQLDLANPSAVDGTSALAQGADAGIGVMVPPSFKDVLNGISAAMDLRRPGTSAVPVTAGQLNQEDNIPCCPAFGCGGKLLIPPALEDLGASRWRITLVGYLLGKYAPYAVLRRICLQLWQKKGLVEVGLINKGAIILRFDSDQHLDGIVGKADWHLAGCPLLLRRWQVGMAINEEPTALPCWVRLSFNPANMGTVRVQIEFSAKNGLSKKIEAIDSRGGSRGPNSSPTGNPVGKRPAGYQKTRMRWKRAADTTAKVEGKKEGLPHMKEAVEPAETLEQGNNDDEQSHVSIEGVGRDASDDGEYMPESEHHRPDEEANLMRRNDVLPLQKMTNGALRIEMKATAQVAPEPL
ncbi:hypothetical protein MLD38_029896 [Melastoma candidum]|uniref:Uncharacterized protein n=1 Tax=Melastoma candidum TaxID=119954 RepID=A0ACB9MLD0_9MYRT|nr:hypothetical protein MLD38_029896 [Melastoma candidum]